MTPAVDDGEPGSAPALPKVDLVALRAALTQYRKDADEIRALVPMREVDCGLFAVDTSGIR